MQRKTFLIGITAIVVFVATLAARMFIASNQSFRSAVVPQAIPAPEISMTDQNGNPFQMSAQQGKVVLLYFGFVNCPEECPLTMAHLKLVFSMLGDSSQDVQVVMISTDPVRDTPQALKEFLRKFNPSFLGISGTEDELAKIWKDYGVQVLDGGETHSSYTYVIDRHGQQRLNFTPDTSSDDIAHDLKILLAEK